jgi:urea transport system ATP-binding protein
LPEQPRYILSINNLIAGYGRREVLKAVSIDVPYGGIVALIGHNGAGKSTLLKAVFGLLRFGLVRWHLMVR